MIEKISLTPLLLGGIAGAVDSLVSGIIEGIFSIFEQTLGAIFGPIGDKLADLWLDLITYTPTPTRGGSPAIMLEPDNAFWPEVWAYHQNFIEISIFLALALYVFANFIGTIPYVSSKYRERVGGTYIRTFVAVILSWPLLTMIIYLIDGINHLFAPDPKRFGTLLEYILGTGFVASIAGPQAVAGAAIAVFNLAFIAIIGALFFVRIFYMVFVMAFGPILVMGLSLDIPVVKGISKTLLTMWVKLGLAPALVGGIYTIAGLMMTKPDGSGGYSYEGLTGIGADSAGLILGLILMFVIPLVGLAGFYFAMQASMGAVGSQATRSLQRMNMSRKMGKSGGSGGSDDDNGGSSWVPNAVEDRVDQAKGKVDDYSQWKNKKAKGAAGATMGAAASAAGSGRNAAGRAGSGLGSAVGSKAGSLRNRIGSARAKRNNDTVKPAVAGEAMGSGGGSQSSYNEKERKAADALNDDGAGPLFSGPDQEGSASNEREALTPDEIVDPEPESSGALEEGEDQYTLDDDEFEHIGSEPVSGSDSGSSANVLTQPSTVSGSATALSGEGPDESDGIQSVSENEASSLTETETDQQPILDANAGDRKESRSAKPDTDTTADSRDADSPTEDVTTSDDFVMGEDADANNIVEGDQETHQDGTGVTDASLSKGDKSTDPETGELSKGDKSTDPETGELSKGDKSTDPETGELSKGDKSIGPTTSRTGSTNAQSSNTGSSSGTTGSTSGGSMRGGQNTSRTGSTNAQSTNTNSVEKSTQSTSGTAGSTSGGSMRGGQNTSRTGSTNSGSSSATSATNFTGPVDIGSNEGGSTTPVDPTAGAGTKAGSATPDIDTTPGSGKSENVESSPSASGASDSESSAEYTSGGSMRGGQNTSRTGSTNSGASTTPSNTGSSSGTTGSTSGGSMRGGQNTSRTGSPNTGSSDNQSTGRSTGSSSASSTTNLTGSTDSSPERSDSSTPVRSSGAGTENGSPRPDNDTTAGSTGTNTLSTGSQNTDPNTPAGESMRGGEDAPHSRPSGDSSDSETSPESSVNDRSQADSGEIDQDQNNTGEGDDQPEGSDAADGSDSE